MATKSIIVKNGQTLFDLALQLYGDVSKVYDIINLNPSIENINTTNLEGQTIIYEDVKNETTGYYVDNSVSVSCRYPEKDSGVYYLQIEKTVFYILQENGFKIII